MFEFVWHNCSKHWTCKVYGEGDSIMTLYNDLSLAYGGTLIAHAYSEGIEYDLETGLSTLKTVEVVEG